MEKHTVNGFCQEIRERSAWGIVSFMFNHKYADENGDFDTMNETLRRCGEYLVKMGEPDAGHNGWGDDNGLMVYYTAEGEKTFNLEEFVQLMFDAKVLDYFARSYIGTNEAYSVGFY